MSNKILVVSGSASPVEASYSAELAKKFIEEYKKLNKDDTFEYLDLNEIAMASKTLTRSNMGTYFNEEDSLKYISQLKSVDKVIMVSPMHNFNVTALIKNYLDHILLANETFSYKYSKKGDAIGLLDHLKVQILTTQGAPYGWYLWGNHTEYLKGTWEFVAAKVNTPVLLAGTKTEPLNKLTPVDAVKTIEKEIQAAAKIF
ncbi:FMN-dependent NADH-azoreductase [Mesoplasma syrphidae]|uniref:FMN dependent NADH:quinone oxidoreductase n=1 Tax=Mesoplasma syrphidae TaxID=225999 RepID=A0A2K9BIN6_9MOLU|nr:FMN-dependent NADH-azoreductase [Mesoplasma syrphidae]AUF83221.1 FMN-dependent NADH-azoreductase [Mesoplasma syrphidae]